MKKKITIGLFTDSFFPMTDGVGRVVDNYAKRLANYANVVVFAPAYKTKYDDTKFNYEVVRSKSFKVPTIDYSLPVPQIDREFKDKLKNYHLDIVHIHTPFTIGKAGLNYAKKHHIPCVGTMHSQYKRDFLRAVKNDYLATKLNNQLIKVFNKCDVCWAVNKEVARIFYEDYGYKCMPLVMNNATEMLPVKNRKKACEIINKKYHLQDEKVFIFVGRINNLKNVFFIVDVLAEMEKSSLPFKYKMLFIGCGQDEEGLKKRIKKHHLEDKVIMCGKVTDREMLANYYVRGDLFLFPSLYDASSIVQIEASSQKTPVLFLKDSATSATVTDNINGFIEEYDIKKYAKRVIDIMTNRKLYDSVCENAYRDLYKNWDDQIDEVYQSYIKLIDNNVDLINN